MPHEKCLKILVLAVTFCSKVDLSVSTGLSNSRHWFHASIKTKSHIFKTKYLFKCTCTWYFHRDLHTQT